MTGSYSHGDHQKQADAKNFPLHFKVGRIWSIAFIFGLSLFLSSCQRVLYYAYGVKNPKVVSSEKIQAKARKHNFKSDTLLSMSENGFLRYATQDFSINNVFIYRDNHRVIPLDSSTCSSSTIDFVKNFRDTMATELVEIDSTNYFNEYFINLSTGEHFDIQHSKKYTAVVFWATFVGKLNKQTSAEWLRELYRQDDVYVVAVALDPREFWELEVNVKF